MLIQWLQVGTNISVLLVGIKMVRFLSRLELKVDIMWLDYEKRSSYAREDRIDRRING